MTEINPIGNNQPVSRVDRTRATQPGSSDIVPNSVRPDDSVQFSDQARLLNQISEVPEVRQDLIESVRADILSGNYETPEKLDVTIERLAEDLFG